MYRKHDKTPLSYSRRDKIKKKYLYSKSFFHKAKLQINYSKHNINS